MLTPLPTKADAPVDRVTLRSVHADQHLRFLITLLIAVALMSIALAWTTIYGWGGQAHDE